MLLARFRYLIESFIVIAEPFNAMDDIIPAGCGWEPQNPDIRLALSGFVELRLVLLWMAMLEAAYS